MTRPGRSPRTRGLPGSRLRAGRRPPGSRPAGIPGPSGTCLSGSSRCTRNCCPVWIRGRGPPAGPASPDPVSYGPESYGAPGQLRSGRWRRRGGRRSARPLPVRAVVLPPDPYGAAEPYGADDPYDPADPYGSADLYGQAEPGQEAGPDDAADPGREAGPVRAEAGSGAGPAPPREAPRARSVFRAPAAVQPNFPPASAREPKPPPEAPAAARVAEPSAAPGRRLGDRPIPTA